MSEPVFIEEPGSGCYGCAILIAMSVIFIAFFAWERFEKIAEMISNIVDFAYISILIIGWTVVFLSPLILGYVAYKELRNK